MYFQHFIHSELVQARQALLDLIVVALIIALIQCSHLHQPITSTSPSHRFNPNCQSKSHHPLVTRPTTSSSSQSTKNKKKLTLLARLADSRGRLLISARSKQADLSKGAGDDAVLHRSADQLSVHEGSGRGSSKASKGGDNNGKAGELHVCGGM